MEFFRWRLVVHPATDFNYEIAWVDSTKVMLNQKDRCLTGYFFVFHLWNILLSMVKSTPQFHIYFNHCSNFCWKGNLFNFLEMMRENVYSATTIEKNPFFPAMLAQRSIYCMWCCPNCMDLFVLHTNVCQHFHWHGLFSGTVLLSQICSLNYSGPTSIVAAVCALRLESAYSLDGTSTRGGECISKLAGP